MARTSRRIRTSRTAPPRASRSGPSGSQLILAAIVAIAGVGALIFTANAEPPAPAPVPSAARIAASANVMGDPGAPVIIDEWGDFQCPACRAFATGPETQLRAAYIATGRVRFVFHHLAFIGAESTWAAEAAECAGEEGRFFDLHDRLYALQSGENTGTFTKANLLKIAHGIGLSPGFDSCLASDRYAQRVRAETAAGQRQGVTATPTIFINGRKVEVALSFANLQAIIDPLLK